MLPRNRNFAESHNDGDGAFVPNILQKRVFGFGAGLAVGLPPDHVVVIAGAAAGLTTKELAIELIVCGRTVEYRFSHAMQTMSARSRPHLVALAVHLGVITPEPAGLAAHLSRQERAACDGVCSGESAEAIAAQKYLSKAAVDAQFGRAKSKMGARTLSELASKYVSDGAWGGGPANV